MNVSLRDWQGNAWLVEHETSAEEIADIGGYEKAGSISDREAEEMSRLAQDLRDQVIAWLKTNHPGSLRAGGRKR